MVISNELIVGVTGLCLWWGFILILRYYLDKLPIKNGNRYKIAKTNDGKMCIVKLQLLWGSNTNEERSGIVDDRYARYSTDKAKVISIFDINDPKIKYKHSFCLVTYEPGKIITSNYDPNVKKIRDKFTSEIMYFKTKLAARSYYHKINSFNYLKVTIYGS